MKIIACDVETTGTDPVKNAAIELSFLLIDQMYIVDRLTVFASPRAEDIIDPDALAVTGKTADEIKQYQNPDKALEVITRRFDYFINRFDKQDKAFFLAYNAGFDLNFLVNFFKKGGNNFLGSYLNWKKLDPLSMVHFLQFTGEFPSTENCKLETIANHLDVPLTAHVAESDLLATWHIFIKLLQLPRKNDFLSQFRDVITELKTCKDKIPHSLSKMAYQLYLRENG